MEGTSTPGGGLSTPAAIIDAAAAGGGVVAQVGASGGTIGLYGATPVARAAAISQTAYSTASRTVAAATTHAITDSSGGTPSTSAVAAITQASTAGSADVGPVKDAIATLLAEFALLKADLLSVKQNVNSLIDDSQAIGIAQ